MKDGHVRIRDWEEYKRLVSEKKPQSITFILEQNGLSPNRELSTLRIIMLHDRRYFMFFDFPKDGILKETGIPLHKDKKGWGTYTWFWRSKFWLCSIRRVAHTGTKCIR